jgi:hypothetical protein
MCGAYSALYGFFTNLLFEIYAPCCRITSDAKKRGRKATVVLAPNADMAGLTIFNVFCIAGLVFLVRFFIALCQKSRPKACEYVIYAPRRSAMVERTWGDKRLLDENDRSWSLLRTAAPGQPQGGSVRVQRSAGR